MPTSANARREPRQWRPVPLPDEAWRPVPSLSAADRTREQDEAAGGREARRIVPPGGGAATASVFLRRQPRGRKAWAYLRYSVAGKTHERYVGEATCATRPENLAEAWRRARERGLTET